MTPEHTFARYVFLYENGAAGRRSPVTQKTERGILKAAAAALPEHPDTGDWLRYFDSRLAGKAPGPLSEASANQHLKVCTRVYEWARRYYAHVLVTNPLDAVPKFKAAALRPRGLSEPLATFPKLLAAMPDARSRAYLCVLRWHGLRMGEGLGLEPRHIDWRGRPTLRIEQQRQPTTANPSRLKSDTASATMPLHPETGEVIRAAMREATAGSFDPRNLRGAAAERFLFPFYSHHLADMMKRCREVSPGDFAERIVGVRGGDAFHVFRHTFGTEVAEAVDVQITLGDAKNYLRHQSLQTTQMYVDSIRGRRIEATKLDALWGRQASALAEREAAEAAGYVVPIGGRKK